MNHLHPKVILVSKYMPFAIWDDSLCGLSAGLKNRRVKARHLLVPPYCSFVQWQDTGLISRECGFESRRSNQLSQILYILIEKIDLSFIQ